MHILWRRRESNPGPNMDQYVHLQPYPVIKSYPLTGLPEDLLKSQSINYAT